MIPLLEYSTSKSRVKYFSLAGLWDPNTAEEWYYIRMTGAEKVQGEEEIFQRELSFISRFSE